MSFPVLPSSFAAGGTKLSPVVTASFITGRTAVFSGRISEKSGIASASISAPLDSMVVLSAGRTIVSSSEESGTCENPADKISINKIKDIMRFIAVLLPFQSIKILNKALT